MGTAYTNLVDKPERREYSGDLVNNYFAEVTLLGVLVNSVQFCYYATPFLLMIFVDLHVSLCLDKEFDIDFMLV
jgi:hypothetical protein